MVDSKRPSITGREPIPRLPAPLRPDVDERLTEGQWNILAQLVSAARGHLFDSSEPFLAVRVGLAGIAIHHRSMSPISSVEMADVDHLSELGFVHLRRLPSGARSFTITSEGFSQADISRDGSSGR